MNQERRDELLQRFNTQTPITATFGMQLSFAADGGSTITLPYNQKLDRASGGIHGGVHATLVDSAGWYAAALHYDVGTMLVTSELALHYLRRTEKTTLVAHGAVLKQGRQQCVAETRIYDGDGALIGHGTGTFVVVRGYEK